MLNPVSLYGETKTEAEKLLLDSGNVSATASLRLSGIQTDALDPLVNDFVYQPLKQEHQCIRKELSGPSFTHTTWCVVFLCDR